MQRQKPPPLIFAKCKLVGSIPTCAISLSADRQTPKSTENSVQGTRQYPWLAGAV